MVKEISPKNKAEFLAAIKTSKRFAVVDFFASWCGPCKQLKPKMEEIAGRTPGVDFFAVDVDKSSALANELGIRSMPTIIFYVDGEEKGKVIGLDLMGIEKNIYQIQKM